MSAIPPSPTKGGVHVSAIQRHPETYEHIRPEKVGNVTRVLVSDLSGRSNILAKAEEFNINLDSKDPVTLEILEEIKEMENQGYQFEGAEASFELLMRRALGTLRQHFSRSSVSASSIPSATRMKNPPPKRPCRSRSAEDRAYRRRGERPGQCSRQCLAQGAGEVLSAAARK